MIETILSEILAELKELNTKVGGRAVLVGNEPNSQTGNMSSPLQAAPGVNIPVVQHVATSDFIAPAQPAAVQVQNVIAPPTREQVGALLIALATEKGREVAGAVLAQFGAGKLAGVPADKYVALCDAIAKEARA